MLNIHMSGEGAPRLRDDSDLRVVGTSAALQGWEEGKGWEEESEGREEGEVTLIC